MKVKFELYTRIGCHLCEEMEHEVSTLESKLNFKTDIITINDNQQLEERYGEKVPVLSHGDDSICEYVLDEKALSKAIKQYS